MQLVNKYTLTFFLIFTIFASFSNRVSAVFYSKYTHYSTQPLMSPGPAVWESLKIQYPNVLFENGLYKMWYSGHNGNYWSVGYALSLDGINWIKYPYNPVLTWNENDANPKHIITPSIINDKGLYRMWFTSSFTDHDDGDFSIGYAISTNGIDWVIQNYKQLIPSQNWDTVGLTHPFVLKISDSLYYMWYSARKNPNMWTIGLATSTNGIDWSPYINNPVITTATVWWERGHNLGPHVIYDNNEKLFKMWYNTSNLGSITSIAYAESTDGYTWQKPVEKNPILLNEIPGYFDYKGLSDGSVIVLGNTDLLWYGGAIISGISNIGLAYLGEAPVALPTPLGSLFPTVTPSSTQIPTDTPTPTSTPIPTTTPTLTPTPSPSPTLTPTPKKKKPVVIVPGMFSSWNKEAILEGKSNVKSMWKLLPFVHEYDGIVQTFKNLGYTENDTLFVYPYDWRKSILDSTALFGQFLSSQVFLKHPDDKIVIIGHSLGGLIARAWIQTGANKDKIDNLITVGSPNQGVIQPYRAWEGGDVSQDDSVISFAASVILHLNQSVLTTDRETVQKIFPVLKDLLPVAPYLIQKSDNSDINKNQMYVWNDFLEKLNSSVSSIYSFIDTVSGTGIDTPNKYIVSTPSKIDFLLGNWQDGKPENIVKAPGDGTVTQSRAIFSDDPSSTLLKNHGALITSREGIEKILQILAVDYTFEDIVEGKTTSFSHGLLFLLRSPATFTVSGNGSVYSDLDSILYIPDASAGEYTTTVVGTGSGTYHLSIGQYSTNGSTWTDITGTTEINKKDTYVVQYTPDSPLDKPIINLSGNDWLSQINAKLLELEKIADKQRIRRIRIELALTEKFLERKNYFIVGKQLEKLLFSLSDIREKSKAETATLTFETGDLVLSVYDLLLRDKPEYFPEKSLSHTVEFLDRTKGKIFKSIDKKKTDIKHILLYQKALNYFVMGKSAFVKSQFAKASIYFLQSKIVFNEVL